ncbi:hypothetical protein ABZX90_30655 [Streptomyces sp. NPDC002935]
MDRWHPEHGPRVEELLQEAVDAEHTGSLVLQAVLERAYAAEE